MFAGEILWILRECLLVFSDCSEHISGKGISFLVVLDLLSSNKTVVKILYSVFF